MRDIITLEFNARDRDEALLVAYDGRNLWCCSTALAEAKAHRTCLWVRRFTRCETPLDESDDAPIGARLLAFAETHRWYLAALRNGTPVGSTAEPLDEEDEVALLLDSTLNFNLAGDFPPALSGYLMELERADMSRIDRSTFIGRPTGGIGF
jgi:hypothetical protein